MRLGVLLTLQELLPRHVLELDRHAVSTGVSVVVHSRVREADAGGETRALLPEQPNAQVFGQLLGNDELGTDATMMFGMLPPRHGVARRGEFVLVDLLLE